MESINILFYILVIFLLFNVLLFNFFHFTIINLLYMRMFYIYVYMCTFYIYIIICIYILRFSFYISFGPVVYLARLITFERSKRPKAGN